MATTNDLSFGHLRALADVLRLSATTLAPLRPFATELFRTQTDFNHRLVDVLEDALWTFEPAQIEARLGPLAAAGPDVPNARGGVQGQLIVWTKRVGLAGLEAALGNALEILQQKNRKLIDALKSRTQLPTFLVFRESFTFFKARSSPPRPASPGSSVNFSERP